MELLRIFFIRICKFLSVYRLFGTEIPNVLSNFTRKKYVEVLRNTLDLHIKGKLLHQP